jgi:hypothetical protein
LLRFGLLGTLTFLGFFIYFYKTSGKFRQSIIAAFAAMQVSFSQACQQLVQQVKLMLLHHNHNIRVILVIVQVSLVVDQAMMVQDQENQMMMVQMGMTVVFQNTRK